MKRVLIFSAAMLILATALFAQRPSPKPAPTPEQQILQAITGQHRDNDRVTTEGRVSRVTPERDGYRVEVENSHDSYWVPRTQLRDRDRDLRAGVTIRIGGVFRGGVIYVDSFGWNDDRSPYREHRRDVIRGYVERVNYRLGFVDVRRNNGVLVRVDIRDVDTFRLRRGDPIDVYGRWMDDDVFRADRIDRARRPW